MAPLQGAFGGTLDGARVWFKGPVYYGRRLELAARTGANHQLFALRVEGDERPAVVGTLLAGQTDRDGL